MSILRKRAEVDESIFDEIRKNITEVQNTLRDLMIENEGAGTNDLPEEIDQSDRRYLTG